MCSLILYLYYTTQCLFCQVKIMLSPLGVVLWNTQGGLFWDKVSRIENEMSIFKMKMKCHFLWRCVLFFLFLYYISARFSYLGFRLFFFYTFYKKYFFAFFHITLSIRCTHSASAACIEYCCHKLSYYSISYILLFVKLRLRKLFLCISYIPTNILYPPPIFHIKNISVQSALCWMYHPLIVGHEC